MTQMQIDTRAIEIAQSAKTAVDLHVGADTLIHAGLQSSMVDVKLSIAKIETNFSDGIGKINRRIDWLMICILAGVGTAALTVFMAMFPWRVQ